MFTFSAKAVYGLEAAVSLGINYNTGPIHIRDISGPLSIPQHYLEQLLLIMKKAGLVDSHRGSQGGYQLARPPSQISVLEILAALEGRIEMVAEQTRRSSLDFFWASVEKQISSIIDMSLEELILKKQDHDNQFIYTI